MDCYKCGADIQLSSGENISRSDTCHSCLTDIRCCKMCEFFDTTAYNDCRESSADRTTEKEKANFCDFFNPGNAIGGSGSSRNDKLCAAEDLFKK